ncbi:MAG TPA: hypothetical protein VGS97_28745 [Actinocrinis sp.]|nr:hypothetical protein [Actinocrinis sp.]
MPTPRTTLLHVFRTAPAKALLAVGCAAIASGTLLAFPPHAAASSASGNILIRPSRPFPSCDVFICLSSPPPQPSGGGGTTGAIVLPPTKHHEPSSSASPVDTSQQFGYVSTFSPAPAVVHTPTATASVACVASGQPIKGSGGDLDLPGIPGSSTDPGHAGALPISTLGPSTMLPPQIDSSNLAQLQITRPVDAASANLAMIASSGYRFPCIHLEFGPGRNYSSVEYALTNAGLVADDRAGNTEVLTWTYSTVLWSYTMPGSAKIHQGSGEINAQPNQVSTSMAQDTRAIALGTIGLAAVVALALIVLYVAGIRRHRARYRERYYRRATLRDERETMLAAVERAQAAQEIEAARWAEAAAREAETLHEPEVLSESEVLSEPEQVEELGEPEEAVSEFASVAQDEEGDDDGDTAEVEDVEPEPEAEHENVDESEETEEPDETEERDESEPAAEVEPEAEESETEALEEPEPESDEPEASDDDDSDGISVEQQHVNGSESVEVVDAPEATAEPEATVEPEASAETEAVAEADPGTGDEDAGGENAGDAVTGDDAVTGTEEAGGDQEAGDEEASTGYRKTPV